jgi:hypothetical protein
MVRPWSEQGGEEPFMLLLLGQRKGKDDACCEGEGVGRATRNESRNRKE